MKRSENVELADCSSVPSMISLEYLHREVADEIRAMFPNVDYIFLQGSNISIKPRAFDPDDNDKLTFIYSGWKSAL